MVSLDKSILPQANFCADTVSDFYKQLSSAYRKAAARLDSDIKRLDFSGGGSARNPLLRESLQSVFEAEACADDNDVMRGLLAIIAQLEEHA